MTSWFGYRDQVPEPEHTHICEVCGERRFCCTDRWGHDDASCDEGLNKLCGLHDDLLADDPEWRAELGHV